MIETNWYVITGAPSSGKTTLINRLTDLGYRTSPEVARACIEELLEKQHGVANNIRQELLQPAIYKIMYDREQHLSVNEPIFFDRGLPDSIAYYRFNHLDSSEVIKACIKLHYKLIFFCESLPLIHDNVRVEDEASAKTIGQYIYESYLGLGYEPILLPAVSVEERMNIILSHIK